MVKPFRVLVQTHESEQGVEDLVVDFEPDVSLRLVGEEGVQHTGHDHEENGAGDGDHEDPQEESHVERVS